MQRLIMDMPLMISGARWAAADHHGKAEVNRKALPSCEMKRPPSRLLETRFASKRLKRLLHRPLKQSVKPAQTLRDIPLGAEKMKISAKGDI